MNIEFVESEDALDLSKEASTDETKASGEKQATNDEDIDVINVQPMPIFASDSEDEEDVFEFSTKVRQTIGNRRNARNTVYDEGTNL